VKKRLLYASCAILLLAGGFLAWYFHPYRLDYGAIRDGVYRNGYFHLTLPVKGWYPVDMEEFKWRDENKRDDGKDVPSVPKRPPAYQRPSIHLVTVYDQGWVPPGEFNASFFAFAEKKSLRPNARDADEYLKGVFADMLVDHPEAKAPEPMSNVLVDGKTAARMRMELTGGGKTYRQEYFSFMARDYYLSLILTWETAEQRLRLQNFLETVKFRL
jgi:hypothetical protein